MTKIRFRLTLIFIALIGLSVLASGIFLAKLLKDSQLEAMKENLIREASIINSMMKWTESGTVQEQIQYFDDKSKQLKKSADSRVTFIRADGTVLGDSDYDPLQMDNHLNREEIQAALHDGEGDSIRYSDTIKRNMLYVAIPVKNDGDVIGITRLSLSLKDVESSIERLWSGLLLFLIFLLIAAAIVSYRIAFGLTKPLVKMTEVAKQITMMNYSSRVKVTNRDEIGQLGQAINKMADSLQLQMDRIQEEESRLKSVLDNMISGVVLIDRNEQVVLLNRAAEDILGFEAKSLLGKKYEEVKPHYELAQIIKECIEKREHISDEITFYFPEERTLELNLVPMVDGHEEWNGVVMVLHDISAVRRLERMRSEFVANVSHELKTPIAAVKGFAETLLAGALQDPEVARSFVQIIYDESERLNRLIGDILELSKIESKRVPLQFSPVEMQSFVGKTIEVMRTEAEKKHIALHMQVSDDIYIEADEDRLRQIFMNLISNGINYTPEGGSVKVTIEPLFDGKEEDYEKVRVTIKDTGIGIPKKDLPRIFERFYRVDKARSRSSGGTGLGLSIVKHLVELHKGTIRVESQIGVGTSFIIDLPVIQ